MRSKAQAWEEPGKSFGAYRSKGTAKSTALDSLGVLAISLIELQTKNGIHTFWETPPTETLGFLLFPADPRYTIAKTMYNRNLSFHFIGIGGSGMSGIAEVLLTLGFTVSGSELKRTAVTDRLTTLGAQISFGHAASNIPQGCSSVVFSSAVSALNPEMVAARELGIPTVRRAEVLAELMRLKYGVAVAGSHGKTTTTSMTAAVLAELDPTVIVGGLVRQAQNVQSVGAVETTSEKQSRGTLGSTSESGARLGRGQYLIAESDESDKSFLLLKPSVAVITNIDAEHLSTYGSLAELKDAFLQFAESVPFYGLCVLCIDDPAVRALSVKITRRMVTYGFSSDAQVRGELIAVTPAGSTMNVYAGERHLGEFLVPMLGRHLALNALAAIAIGLEFGVAPETIKSSLGRFAGVRRRLEHCGTLQLSTISGVEIYSDYGHHPTEVQACIRALRESFRDTLRRLIVIFQPHRYTRTAECFDEFVRSFDDVDHLLVTEIYSAGEASIEGISSEKLVEALTQRAGAGRSVALLPNLEGAEASLEKFNLGAGDFVLCLGAGSIGSVPEMLLAGNSGARVEEARVA